ncbi:hypothetical protein BGX27_005540 [Mortierella sp. AM989]|nr:hypothetical protein BGX27_005540 [Mortierella sp. AM989]
MDKLQQYETTTATTPLTHSASAWVNNKKREASPFDDPLQTTHSDSSLDHLTPLVNSSNKDTNGTLIHIDSQSRDLTDPQINHIGTDTLSFADPLQQDTSNPLSFSKTNYDIDHMLEENSNPGETKRNCTYEGSSVKTGTAASGQTTLDDPAAGLLKIECNNYNHKSKEDDSERQLTTAKTNSPLSIASMTATTATETTIADNETHPVMTKAEGTVQNLDPLSPLVSESARPRRPLRSRTLSSPVQSRFKPLEHLTNMGPLELEREIDSGVHLSMESASSTPTLISPAAPKDFASTNLVVTPADISARPLQQLSRRPSTSTLVSEASHSSSTTTRRTEQDSDAEGMVWSGVHPLLMDYMAEPELLEDESDHNFEDQTRLSMRGKGHSMSVDVRQSSTRYQDDNTDIFISRSSARRRWNASKANDDRSWTSHGDNDLEHGKTIAETAGKRVIIHQVTPTDTLAGIALYYGIQVPILKKSNKLWTNDSIHTRKYLYIPFEECAVARRAGVMVDEDNQTVLIPQRIQHQNRHHSRSGSAISPGAHPYPSSFTSSRMSTYDATIGSTNGSLPNTQQDNNLQVIMESSSGLGMRSRLGTDFTSDNSTAMSPPSISAVAAGMLPSSSSPLTSSPSRIGTWIDAKSMAAPPLPSPTITTTTLMSDNSLKASPLSSRRSNTTDSPRSASSGLVPFSEDLPDTVVVSPSMTHEALAARFKEMDIIISEQQQRKLLGQEQELRINPVHQRHRTTDLRQFASLQQILDSGKKSLPTSSAGSRRTSMDVGAHESTVNSAAGPLGRRGPAHDSEDIHASIEEEEHVDVQGKEQRISNGFIAYGRHQHIYETSDLPMHGDHGSASDRQLDHNVSSEDNSTLRRQELVTLPVGMLSYFPSSEHSKKLETPQSISRIQNQMENYHRHSPSLSSSTSSGSFRETLSPRDGSNIRGTRAKGRAALNDQTFQSPRAPSLSSTANSDAASQRQRNVPSSSSDTIYSSGTKTSAYSKAVRVNQQQQYFTAQKWSAMGESLVDDILGAVRGPLQIARRVYNFTTLGFGATVGGSGSGSKDSLDFDSSSVRRRTSTRGRSGRRNKEFRNSDSAIELDQATFLGSSSRASNTANTVVIEANITKRVPTTLPTTTDTNSEHSNGHSGRTSRRKSSSGHGHFSGSSSSSTRKRSLRSSNPVNHAALMALVNELDKEDRREKEVEKENELGQEKTISSDGNNRVASLSPPVVDILATSF